MKYVVLVDKDELPFADEDLVGDTFDLFTCDEFEPVYPFVRMKLESNGAGFYVRSEKVVLVLEINDRPPIGFINRLDQSRKNGV